MHVSQKHTHTYVCIYVCLYLSERDIYFKELVHMIVGLRIIKSARKAIKLRILAGGENANLTLKVRGRVLSSLETYLFLLELSGDR